jgi:hypothetical protein|tara:strand:+ start:5468 stop:5872 length:405 start_codon:yes stop_codon:yes gene_type:complete
MYHKEKKKKQLGMNPGTASNRLKKSILFSFAKKLGLNWCYQCGTEITNIHKFTVEHKTPWLDSDDPKKLFFDLDNIAFSHASCNYAASRSRKAKPCPSVTAYRNGCRCEGCLEAKREYRRKKREFKNKLNEKKL